MEPVKPLEEEKIYSGDGSEWSVEGDVEGFSACWIWAVGSPTIVLIAIDGSDFVPIFWDLASNNSILATF